MLRLAPCDWSVLGWLSSRARPRHAAVSAAAAAIALILAGGRAAAHTKAIGYCSDGCGSVTFWFQSWHNCVPPFNEGSFNLVGINGNTFPSTTVPFTLSTCVKPPCLIDGVNNFYACLSNPTGLCPTDEDATGGSKWQGVTFGNLQAGDYLFTYIPIANPSQDWDPATDGVLSNVMTVREDCSCVSAPAGMVGWWPLDETETGPVLELVAGADGVHTGEPGAPPPVPMPGKVQNGLYCFRGSASNHVEVADAPSLDLGTGDFTVDCWVKLDFASCYTPLVAKGASYSSDNGALSDVGFEWGIKRCHVQLPLIYLMLSSGIGQQSFHTTVPSMDLLSDNEWHHLAVVVQRTGSSPAGVTFYDNGVAMPDASGVLPLQTSLTTPEPLFFAKHGGGSGLSDAFSGILDEVEIFSRALAEEEILRLYTAGSAGKCKCADWLEGDGGNDTCETAFLLPFASFIDLDLSKTNPDWYRVVVPPWSKLTVELGFTHALGDVNAFLYGSCGGPIVKSVTGTGDGEVLVWTNSTSATVTRFVQVVVAPDSPANCTRYSMQWWTTKLAYDWDVWFPLPNPIGGVRPR